MEACRELGIDYVEKAAFATLVFSPQLLEGLYKGLVRKCLSVFKHKKIDFNFNNSTSTLFHKTIGCNRLARKIAIANLRGPVKRKIN